MTPEFRNIVRHYRLRGARPAVALNRARAEIVAATSAGKKPTLYYGMAPGEAGVGGYADAPRRWIECPRNAGLRFVGYADEIARKAGCPRMIDHRGWYQNESGYWTLRGAVYQLPGRDGMARYVPAYVEFEGDKPMNGESALFDFSDITAARTESAWDYDGMLQAACDADSLAEKAAESEREFNAAWHLADAWKGNCDEMEAQRAAARQLVRDMRAAIKSGMTAAPSICAALRAQIRHHLEAWETAKESRDEMAAEFSYWHDGRRLSIAEFAAANL